jgi:hypothetical protein
MRRLIKKRRLREMSRAIVFAYDEHPYAPKRQLVLRLMGLEDFPYAEHPYRAGVALNSFLHMFVRGLTGGKSLMVFG